ncbi:MAG: hypothetical protein LUH01_07560, partial [Parabacteroides gordonii]|nr:hypothetical protein [Parabacteroides gordonii]
MVSERDSLTRQTVSGAKKIKKNQDGLQTGREVSPADIPFHRQVIIPKVENKKGHPHFFEAKVAVPHRGARPGPYGSAGKKSSSLREGTEKYTIFQHSSSDEAK